MTGFLSRLASRAVASVAAEPAAPSLQPLSAMSAFSPGPEQSFGFVEEHVERVAESPRAAERSAPQRRPQASAISDGRPAPVANQPRLAGELAPLPARPVPQPIAEAPSAAEIAPVVSDLEPVLPDRVIPAAVAQPEPVEGDASRSDGQPTVVEPNEIEVQVVAAPPLIERVIEVHEVPGPVVPVVRRVTVPAADRRETPTAEQPSLMSTTVAEPDPTVVFVPGEPLGRMGIDPLQPDDILAQPQVARAVGHESTVHVHIGRLEVARPAPPYVPPPAPPKQNLLSLNDYLAERSMPAAGRGRL